MDYTYKDTEIKIQGAFWRIIGYNVSRQVGNEFWHQVGILPYPTKEMAIANVGALPQYFQLPSIVITVEEMKEKDVTTILYEKLKNTDFFREAEDITK